MRSGVMQTFAGLDEFGLNVHNPFPRQQTYLQFRRIKGFAEKIVGPCPHSIE